MQTQDPNNTYCDLDQIIEKLLSVREERPGKLVNLQEEEIIYLIRKVQPIIQEQPVFLELSAPIQICGDIHGQYYDLLRLFECGGYPPSKNYLFLGDYVDWGKQNLETICLLFAYKIKYPLNFFILRGNHESDSINRIYGFYEECKRRHSIKLWKMFSDCFNYLPVSALIENKILCMHGGLSPELTNLNQIREIKRPLTIPDTGISCDLLWSDPEKGIWGWGPNERGVSYTFGEDVLKVFLESQGLDIVVWAHQVVEDGYEFFGNKNLVTVFSAPNYCDEFDNSSAILEVQEDLMCSFTILQPVEKKLRQIA